MDLRAQLGGVDIYLIDQILRGNIVAPARVLDAGCGGGRNLRYFLREGYEVHGVDSEPVAVDMLRQAAEEWGVADAAERLRVEDVASMSFADASFDVVIANALLHFARDRGHFEAMVAELVRVTTPGGLGFVRLATTIGLEASVLPVAGRPEGWVHLPDGSERFVVDLEDLLGLTTRHSLTLVDPIKTTNVQNLRCMTTWVWRR